MAIKAIITIAYNCIIKNTILRIIKTAIPDNIAIIKALRIASITQLCREIRKVMIKTITANMIDVRNNMLYRKTFE